MAAEAADDPAFEIADDREQGRYELRLGDRIAGIVQYRANAGRIALLHTEIDRDFEGRGLAARLIAHVLEDARGRGLCVLPYCPFVKEYIQRHPEYRALVPEAKRANFGLDR